MGLPHRKARSVDRPADGQDDQLGPPGLADRSCCCPATPMVRVLIPATSQCPRRVDLLLCRHHYRASRTALAALGAVAIDKAGAVLELAPAGSETRGTAPLAQRT
jgi:hypothetical protein